MCAKALASESSEMSYPEHLELCTENQNGIGWTLMPENLIVQMLFGNLFTVPFGI